MVQRNGLPVIPADRCRPFVRSHLFKSSPKSKSSPALIHFHINSFLMNGKGLCLMTMDMFTVRAPLGGKTLFKVRP